jgi:hypothetical protein
MIKIVLPIMNKSTSLLRGPTHYLDDDVWIDKLSDEEYGAISRAPVEYSAPVQTDHRCIFISLKSAENIEKSSSLIATSCRYVLNNFRTESPLALPFAIVLQPKAKGNGMIVTKAFELSDDTRHTNKDDKYKIKSGVSREEVSSFYKVVKNACERHKKLKLTINRFNSALSRPKLSDKIIDTTISLESMVQDDKTELSFKFALYNSYAANKHPEKRLESFELFKKLYNTRSTIVHGAADEAKETRLLTEIESDWTKIEETARRAINELVFFVQNGDPSTWTKHLLDGIIHANLPQGGKPE